MKREGMHSRFASHASLMSPPLALYIHIPFCAARCSYCDFDTYAGLQPLFTPYVSALAQEIRQAGEKRDHHAARTIFIGGGTPTVLPSALLEQVLDACRDAFDLDPHAEITCEANPGTVDEARFDALRRMGVNRLSIGVQSFDDGELRWLGRIHTAAEAQGTFAAARATGFDNINLDLIFGLPEQETGIWASTLARAATLDPEHMSLYSLTIEPGTPLANRVRRGLVPQPDDDLAADLYLAACDFLHGRGYLQYEISNWARSAIPGLPVLPARPGLAARARVAHRPGSQDEGSSQPSAISYQCQHNLVYWHNEPYLGFGAGAHSYDGQRRWWNVRPITRYIQRVTAGRSPEAGGETIDRRPAMGETMMLGLRLVEEGVGRERFRARFGVSLEEAFSEEIRALVARGLLEQLSDRVRLTPVGRLLGNLAFAEFQAPPQ